MLLPPAIAAGVASGDVRLAFRRWARARVKAGGTFLTTAGTIEVTSIEQTDPNSITEADARAAGSESAESVRSLLHGAPTDPIFRIGLAYSGPDPRVAPGDDAALSDADVADISTRLNRLDKRSSHGAWTLSQCCA